MTKKELLESKAFMEAPDDADFQDRKGNYYWEHQLYFGTLDDFDNDEPDY